MANVKRPRRQKGAKLAQPFDTTFKDWIRQEAYQAIPYLVPGAVCEGPLDTEIIRPTMRADKVFRINLGGEAHIGNFEFQTGRDERLVSRLHLYQAALFHDYQLPVLSMIIYPFRTTIATSPLVIMSQGRESLRYHFKQLELYGLEAERYVLEQAYCMYPLLPAMQGANHKLLKRAMDELAALHGDDEVTLAQQFVWMQILLERTETIDLDEKERIQETMQLYDPLWENHPKVKKFKAESLAKGRAEGRAEAQAEAQAKGQTEGRLVEGRKMLITVVSALFPTLGDLAEQAAKRITSPDQLELLIEQIVKSGDEQTARFLLKLLVA